MKTVEWLACGMKRSHWHCERRSGLGVVMLLPLILLGLAGAVQAQVRWEKQDLKVEARAGAAQAEAVFQFTNGGQAPVRIESVEGGCACLQLSHSEGAVAPGGRGFVRAVFFIGQRRGLQSKMIVVKTDAPGSGEALLGLEVDIKETVKLEPALVYWRQKEKATGKTVRITIGEGEKVKVLGATASDPRFEVALRTVAEGREYEMIVTPKDTGAPVACQIAVQTEQAGGAPLVYQVFAYVK